LASVDLHTWVGPVVTSVTNSLNMGMGGELHQGDTVTLTLNLSEAATITGGPLTLSLNDGGTATYNAAASTATALAFDYTGGPHQATGSLAITGVNLNGATVHDEAGTAFDFALAQTNLPIGVGTFVSFVEVPEAGQGIDLNAGHTISIVLHMNDTVSVSGGTPTLALNDGGTATYDAAATAAVGGPMGGPPALVFTYTVGPNDTDTPALAVTGIDLHGATILDSLGSTASLANALAALRGVEIDTSAPTVSSVVASGAGISTGHLQAGDTITLTVNLSEAVAVDTTSGTPTLALNDGA